MRIYRIPDDSVIIDYAEKVSKPYIFKFRSSIKNSQPITKYFINNGYFIKSFVNDFDATFECENDEFPDFLRGLRYGMIGGGDNSDIYQQQIDELTATVNSLQTFMENFIKTINQESNLKGEEGEKYDLTKEIEKFQLATHTAAERFLKNKSDIHLIKIRLLELQKAVLILQLNDLLKQKYYQINKNPFKNFNYDNFNKEIKKIYENKNNDEQIKKLKDKIEKTKLLIQGKEIIYAPIIKKGQPTPSSIEAIEKEKKVKQIKQLKDLTVPNDY